MSAKNCILTNDKVEKMTEIIGYLPQFHRDAVYIRHDSSDDKVNSFQWVADELSQDYGTFISTERAMGIYEDACDMIMALDLGMGNFRKDETFILTSLYGENNSKTEYRKKDKKYINSVVIDCIDEKRNSVILRLVPQNSTGISNLKSIMSALRDDDELYYRNRKVCDLSYINTHRDGILIGRSLSWRIVDKLRYCDEKKIHDTLKEIYGWTDFVEIPGLTELCFYDGGYSLYNDPSLELTKTDLNGLKELMPLIISKLQTNGIYIIPVWSLYLYRFETKTALLNYYYLGMRQARELVIDSVKAFSEKVDDLDPQEVVAEII